jgi:hypothetical protein
MKQQRRKASDPPHTRAKQTTKAKEIAINLIVVQELLLFLLLL